ncbi:hypothetical protein KA005_75175 [bacterium]|nr:hypothetical protein [bacterium]
MMTIKIIGVMHNDRQQTELLDGAERLNYECPPYKIPEFGNRIMELIGEGDQFTYHGLDIPDKDRKSEVSNFLVLRMFKKGEWETHVIRDSWVYITNGNGKTIEKFDVI